MERNIPRVYRGVEADVPLVPLFERSSGTWARAIFFSGDFRSYTSGNKPLTCGDGISGIALIELTLYNTSCIDKWLSTRPVFDAGLLPGIGAERSVK